MDNFIDPNSIADENNAINIKHAGHIPVGDTQKTAGPEHLADLECVADLEQVADQDIAEPTGKRKHDEDDDEYIPGPSKIPKHGHIEFQRVTRSQAELLTPNAERIAPVVAAITAVGPTDPYANKPEPHGQPPAWSDKRAALNDSLPYFKAHQGSIHTTDLIPKGMLIDSIVGVRDHFSSQVIITSVGGGRVPDLNSGEMVRDADQGDDGKNYKSLKLAWETRRPFVMIAGARNKLFPVNPPHYYNVLDYFHVTDMWQEKTMGAKGVDVRVHMVRLEKVDLARRSWWAPRDADAHDAGEFEVGQYSCASSTCEVCRVSSKELYKQGWACLNKDCEKFFQFGRSIGADSLEYSDAFLRERTRYSGAPFQDALIPPLPQAQINSIGSEKQFKQGVVCPQCGACCRRIKWDGWHCESPGCDFTYTIPIRMVPLRNIKEENSNLKYRKRRDTMKFTHKSIAVYKAEVEGHILKTYFLPDEKAKGRFIGSVTRIRANKERRLEPNGLDDLYVRMQGDDLQLERRPAKNAGGRVEELTSHFAGNFGAPYKFSAVVKTTTNFEDAPPSVLETLVRLTWAGKTAADRTAELIEENEIKTPEAAIPRDYEPYNEQLVLGYFEKSKISAHDDGEKELGPSVASLSLGSPSVMKFLPKKGVDIGEGDKEKKIRKPVMSIVLKHGDMLVMHGRQIHKLYLHSVDPCGKHRFALTCRHIRPNHLPAGEQRNLAAVAGKVPEEWADMKYNGDKDRFESVSTGETASDPSTLLGQIASIQNSIGTVDVQTSQD